MLPGSDRFSTRRDSLAFVTCLILSVTLRVAPTPWTQALASSVRRTLLAPLLAVQRQAEMQKNARVRYSAVLAERDSAVTLAQSVFELTRENEALRALLDLRRRLPAAHASAEVLHQPLPSDGVTLLLSAGETSGVGRLDPVVAPGGLLGAVQDVERESSVAMTWAHPDFRASTMTEDAGVFGVVAPRGSSDSGTAMLELRGVPYLDRVPNGVRLYTSGIGGVYPRGIPVGTVVAVAEDREGWVRTYLVRPAVHPGGVGQVIILTGYAGRDLSETFEPEQ